MAKEIHYTIKNYAEIDLAELAEFAVKIWNAKGNQYNVERFTNWLNNLEYDIEPNIVQAKREDQLIGWLMVFAHSKTELELNPFALGAHPIIIDDESKTTITNSMLQTVIDYFQQSEYTRIELFFNKEGTDVEKRFKDIYETFGFKLMEQICHMRFDLADYQAKTVQISDSLSIKRISDVDNDIFYDCLYATFKDSKDNWMQSLSDNEIKDNFETRVINMSFKLVEDCSFGIFDNDNLVAYSVVRESHGSENGHLWIMGVHPKYRRQKIGTYMIDSMLTNLKRNEFKTSSLNVDLSNTPAYDLYSKIGFVEDWTKLAYVFKKEK